MGRMLLQGIKLFCFVIFSFLTVSAVAEKLSLIDRMTLNRDNCALLEDKIIFCGSLEQSNRVGTWLTEIQNTHVGDDTLTAIRRSPHRLMIAHEDFAATGAGKAMAEATSRLMDGRGAEVVIQMNFNMPDTGTHRVGGVGGIVIAFDAITNFFHELSHARHKMNGTWLAVDPEGQAVRDENLFRSERTYVAGEILPELRDLRFSSLDIQVWFQ